MPSLPYFEKERIRELIDFPEFVAETVPLPRIPNGRGPVMVRCPFHDDKEPSLAVYPDHAHCFGCDTHLDLFGWAMKLWNVEFLEALDRLAQRAGIPNLKMSPEQLESHRLQRNIEEILELATQFYSAQLYSDSGKQALSYARSRGWSDKTIRDARLGFAPPNQDLTTFLSKREVDIIFVQDMGLLRSDKLDFCANQSGYEESPDGYLIYPHIHAGRIEYIAGRSIIRKVHRNLPGAKHLFYNHAYSTKHNRVVIVEGPADAISLAEFNFPAVAMCGTSPNEEVESLKRHSSIWVSPDSDGKTGLSALIDIFGPQTRIVSLPAGVKDLNAFHQSGKEEKDFSDLLENAPTWLTIKVETVSKEKGLDRETATRELFQLITTIKDKFTLTQIRPSVARSLNLGLREYDQLLKATLATDKKAEEKGSASQNNRYVIEDGKICEVKYSDSGVSTEPLCNFIAQITEQIYRDDGEESSLEFALEGRLDNGRPLHTIRIPSSSYNSLNWVSSEWGVEAIIRAGVAKKDRLREAIQLLSSNMIKRRIYTHIGWTKIDGEYVYLSASGGLRSKDVSVDLEKGLDIYRLPTVVQSPVAAMQASLRFLEVGPLTVTVPLWAAVFLAPLSESVSVAFALWLYGITGTRKSTLAALTLNHYGDGFTTTSLPADWWATDNSLEKNLFIVKDALFVIDDYRPESDPIRRRELEGKVARIVRQVGNRSGRSRMKADLTLRKTYRPRGLLLSTGEQIPNGQSIVARLLVLEIKKDDLDLIKLTAAQNESHLYSEALVGYLDWLAPQIEQQKSKMSSHWKEIRQSLMNKNQHGRIPEIVASLVIGLELGLRYALEIKAITQEEFEETLYKGKYAISQVANQQSNRVDREKPTFLFFTILADLLVQQRVCLTNREGNSHGLGGNPDSLNKPERIGWCDDQYIYLLPATYNRIYRYCLDEGKEFPAKEAALRKMLKEEGYLISEDGRNTNRLWQGDSHERVLQIRRAVLDEFSVNKIPTW